MTLINPMWRLTTVDEANDMEREVDLEGGNRRERMTKAKKRLKRFLSDEPPIPDENARPSRGSTGRPCIYPIELKVALLRERVYVEKMEIFWLERRL